MDYEKLYKEAISRADKHYARHVVEDIFPELKESEDERIKTCIQVALTDVDEQRFNDYETTLTDCIAWIEKQGEQKPIEQDTEIRDLWVYIREWNEKFGRLPKDEDELASCIDYVMKRQKLAEWSEEDEAGLGDALWAIKQASSIVKDENDMGNLWYAENWLKSIKERVQPQPKQEWSEEDEEMLTQIINEMEAIKSNSSTIFEKNVAQDKIDWLKSITRKEILKDLPKWMKITQREQNYLSNGYLSHGEYYLDIKELIEKLPKEE